MTSAGKKRSGTYLLHCPRMRSVVAITALAATLLACSDTGSPTKPLQARLEVVSGNDQRGFGRHPLAWDISPSPTKASRGSRESQPPRCALQSRLVFPRTLGLPCSARPSRRVNGEPHVTPDDAVQTRLALEYRGRCWSALQVDLSRRRRSHRPRKIPPTNGSGTANERVDQGAEVSDRLMVFRSLIRAPDEEILRYPSR